MIVLADAEYRTAHDRIFIHLDKTPERDGQTDIQPVSVCIASNADAQ